MLEKHDIPFHASSWLHSFTAPLLTWQDRKDSFDSQLFASQLNERQTKIRVAKYAKTGCIKPQV